MQQLPPAAPMDFTGLAETPENPSPNPNFNPNHNPYPSPSSYATATNPSAGYFNPYPYNPAYYTSTEPPNALLQPRPPGVESPYVPPPVTVRISHVHNPVAYQPQQSVDPAAVATSTYYPDPNVSWTAPYGQFGAAAPDAASMSQGITLPNAATQLHISKNRKKGPKKMKIVQSAWCEVCKISCNSKDVLDNHKLGNKHKKNLEKLKNPTNTIPAPIVASTSIPPIIGPQENRVKVLSSNAQKSKKKKAAASEDLESKRRKVLNEGAAAEEVRTCMYCNVVCNSATVFNYHIAGQKHAAMMKRYAAMAGVAFVV